MRITALETIRTTNHDNLVWVYVETDTGHRGLGETFFAPTVIETYVHDVLAPLLLGGDATRIEHWHAKLTRYPVGYGASSAEMRAASAVDIALWDLMGRATGLPLWRLLGGLVRDRIPVYNTCAGPHYATQPRGDVSRWFGIDTDQRHDLDDLKVFLEEPERLAKSLLAEGVRGMKVWPFDFAAYANGGVAITTQQIAAALQPLERIRAAVSRDMDIMIDLHGLWDFDSARRIAHALEPLEPTWLEDPIRMDDAEGVAQLARSTRIPLLGSETTATKESFRRLMELRALGVVSFDVGWCGGITEAQKIAVIADSFQIPIAPHDCTGPIGYAAGVSLSLTSRNARIQEMVRAYTRGWYAEIVTALPEVRAGHVHPLPDPGLGLDLSGAFLADNCTLRRRSGGN
jgi:L-alanine-DL-glutamate epimerase-like enolase superfamily enzyme